MELHAPFLTEAALYVVRPQPWPSVRALHLR